MNIIEPIPDHLQQGSTEYRFEIHRCMQKVSDSVILKKSIEDLASEFKEPFIEFEESDEECYLDQEKIHHSLFITDSNKEFMTFRGVKMRYLQILNAYKKQGNVLFVFINDVNDNIALEHRLATVYGVQKQFKDVFVIVCIRGIKDMVALTQFPNAYYLKRLNILRYRAGFSKMFSDSEKSKPLCALYFEDKG
jgi:hypothetical protein